MRTLLVLTFTVIVFFSTYANAQCSPASPCASGCCSTYGSCGFGPEYCGVGNCTSTCSAVAQCGQYAPSNATKCPLGVCCSEYGFCGTTSDFCGTGCQNGCAAVTEPSCSGQSSNQRMIGYYESWTSNRPCDVWLPEIIDATLWTHLNYAFALIDGSNRISQMNSYDTDYYKRFVALKLLNPSLKVFISVGGWGQGAVAWSKMASTQATRAVFIQSAIQFMTMYGFDGIDLDWEYPAAGDRGGVPEDTANFVSLLKEFRAAIGNDFGISATIPSSYWYMQGFDIVNMVTYLDWINFMAYDIHGTWDGATQWTSAIVQPHTNLTEISLGLDLLWRNNIEPSKVVLGMAFYGRSFTLQSPACSAVDCPFSGGGNAGTCTGTVGILSDSEIRDIISTTGVTPTLDKTAGVKWITWDSDQWVSYDDADTFIIKREFANELCLGGVMVWALDQDDVASSTSAIALYQARTSKVATAVSALVMKQLAGARSQAVSAYLSAYWTTCSSYAYCAPGYNPIGYASGRIMEADVDLTADNGVTCGYGGWTRAFCMAANAQTTGCKWYGTPKDCNVLCPAGYLALAYNSQPNGEAVACKGGAYAVLCCQSVWAQPISQTFCDTEDPISGSIVIRKVLAGGAVGTVENSAIDSFGFGFGSGGSGIGVSSFCINSYTQQLDTSMYDAPGDIGGYFDNTGELVQDEVPDLAAGEHTTSYPVYPLTDTTITTVYSTSTVTCSGSIYPQACLHYRSVIETDPSLGILTCPPVAGAGRPAVVSYNSQHTNVWITSWIQPFTRTRGASSGRYDDCQRDEYPPFAFYQGLPGAYIRLVPGSQNGGAGQGFKSICFFPPKTAVNRVPQGVIAYAGYYIDYTSEYITTTLGVMDYQFDAGVPNYDDDGLGNNQCNPAILTLDNGFALLTDDPWYTRNNYQNHDAHNAAAYRFPPADSLTAGLMAWGEAYAAAWAEIGDDPNLAPPAKAKRWLDEQGMDFSDATPDTIFISEGNSTRRPTEKELFELFGFWKCKSGDCDQELANLGLTLRVQEPLVIPEQVITASSLPPAEATLKPASGAGSWKGSIPVSVVGSGNTQSAEATPTVTTGPVPTGRFMRPSHVEKHRVKSYHN